MILLLLDLSLNRKSDIRFGFLTFDFLFREDIRRFELENE